MFTSDNPLHADFRGPKRPTQKVPGIYAGDMNSTGQKSVKDCRLSDKRGPGIRSKTAVGLCTGYVLDSDPQDLRPTSKNARRKARRYGRI